MYHFIIHYIFTQLSVKIKVLFKEKNAFQISIVNVGTMSMGILPLFSHAEACGTELRDRASRTSV